VESGAKIPISRHNPLNADKTSRGNAGNIPSNPHRINKIENPTPWRSETPPTDKLELEIKQARLCEKYRILEGRFGEAQPMTKADLVEEVTQLGDLTRRDGEVIVETIFDSVIGALKSGDKIEIRGFGSFRIRQRKPRIGRNPKTGARVDVPAKRVPYFKPSKELRDLVNPKAQ
jgi:integration host factor subunit beta